MALAPFIRRQGADTAGGAVLVAASAVRWSGTSVITGGCSTTADGVRGKSGACALTVGYDAPQAPCNEFHAYSLLTAGADSICFAGLTLPGANLTIDDVIDYLAANDIVGKDWIGTRSGTLTKDEGVITAINKTGGRTISLIREDGVLTGINDGTRTTTLDRDGQGKITGWTVA